MARPTSSTASGIPRWLFALVPLGCLAAVVALLLGPGGGDSGGSDGGAALGLGNSQDEVAAIRPESLQPGASRPAPTSGATPNAPAAAPTARVALAEDGQPLELATHAFQVVAADTREPLAEAELRLIDDAEALVATLTDAEGRARLDWPVGVPARLEVLHEQYVDLREDPARLLPFDPQSTSVDNERRLPLSPTGSLAGRVVVRDGYEVAGLEVGLWNKLTGRFRGEPDLRVAVDEAGEFRFDGLRPGAVALATLVPERAPRVESGWTVLPRNETQATLYLDPGADLAVRVTSGNTQLPVEQVRVRVQPEVQGLAGDVEENFERVEYTGPDGESLVAGLPTGAATVTVRTPWGAYKRDELTLDAGRNLLEFDVREPARVSGEVFDPDGAPVGGATVALVRHGQRRDASFDNIEATERGEQPLGAEHSLQVTRADGLGRFSFDGVPTEENVWLVALPPLDEEGVLFPGNARLRNLPPGGELATARVELRFGGSVQGVLRDPEGLPMPAQEVELHTYLANSRRTWETALTDEEGRFEFPSAPEGAGQLRAEVEGFRRVDQQIAVPPGDTLTQDLDLVSDLVLAGRVVDPDGFAVPYAYVRLERERNSSNDRADAFGRFEIDDLSPGRWQVRAWTEGYDDIGRNELTVELPYEGEYELVLEPEPIQPTASVNFEVVHGGTGKTVPGLRVDGTRGGVVQLNGRQVDVRGIRPGRTRLRVQAEGFSSVDLPRVDLLPGGHRDLGRVELFPAAEARVTVRDPEGKHVGKASGILEPLPVGLGGIGDERHSVRLREDDGSYRAGRVPIGAWTLVVRKKQHATLTLPVEVTADGLKEQVMLVPRVPQQK
ncbi:MAG: carboxypeptidase regulatory-like domain-containing protein [Planctomycetota bacterium]|jgi:protocatechuate 3,4-dioxygenase beta subunit